VKQKQRMHQKTLFFFLLMKVITPFGGNDLKTILLL